MEEWKGEQQPRLNRDWAIPKSGAVTQDDFWLSDYEEMGRGETQAQWM